MADNTASSSSSSTAKEPTPGDVAFMVHLFKFIKEKPAIDWDEFATVAGFKNAMVAQTRYGQIKRKFCAGEVVAPTTPKKRKAADDSSSSASKTKKAGGSAKGKKGKSVVKAEEVAEEVAEEDEGEGEGEDNKSKLKLKLEDHQT